MYIGELQPEKSLRSKTSSWQSYSRSRLSGVQHSDIAVRAGNGDEPFDRNSAGNVAGDSVSQLGTATDGRGCLLHEAEVNSASVTSKATLLEV